MCLWHRFMLLTPKAELVLLYDAMLSLVTKQRSRALAESSQASLGEAEAIEAVESAVESPQGESPFRVHADHRKMPSSHDADEAAIDPYLKLAPVRGQGLFGKAQRPNAACTPPHRAPQCPAQSLTAPCVAQARSSRRP